jgi:galactokinase
MSERLRVSTPGRVCLFGEHQDYLALPVVPCAISRRIVIEGSRRRDLTVHIHLPDIQSSESFLLEDPLPYIRERDYFRSCINVMRRRGFSFSGGFDCEVRSRIPINAGTSSSSALIVTWVNFLARMGDQSRVLTGEEVARLAHEAEVVEFGEPGGMMDHYSTACGGIIAIDLQPAIKVTPLKAILKTFVLGDSGEPKDTKSILARVKNRVLDIQRRLAERHPGFSLLQESVQGLDRFSAELDGEQMALLRGTVHNHELTKQARGELGGDTLDHRRIGSLLNEHQSVLRDILRISTPKIDRMIDGALSSGAYGAKINGSGGGGCMFAYAPENAERVAEAIEREGGRAYIVLPDEGTRIEQPGVSE